MSKTHRWLLACILLICCLFVGASNAQEVSETLANSTALDSVLPTTSTHWSSVIPPIIAIILALLTRQVLFSLFVAIWIGAWIIDGSSLVGIGTGFYATITDYIVPGIATPDHVSIILFSILIGGMIGVISENGGTTGFIDVISRYIKTQRQGMVLTSLVGLVIFFDDYANTMVVGNTMRPLTDKLKITRAKLAYLVDSTSAPVATVALVSTWIGAMLGYISDAESKMPDYHEQAYSVFMGSLQYNFYAFLTIFFVFVISASGKDFGPMLTSRIQLLKAEKDPSLDKYGVWHGKSENENDIKDSEKKSSPLNALIPIIVLIASTSIGLYVTGTGETLRDIIASANSYAALLWGSLTSLTSALLITTVRKLLPVETMMKAMMKGMHTMLDGVIILVMAWALSELTSQLHTADYLVSVFSDSLNPFWIPVVIFILSSLTSFSTGSSWGTMGILMPLVIPLTWAIGKSHGLEFDVVHELIYASVASVLAGSVWGDHCSPISDTTILSSISSRCDHIEHVKTQLPYSLFVGVVSMISLILVCVFNLPTWVIYVAFIPLLYFAIQKFGDRASELNLDAIEVAVPEKFGE